MDFALTVLASLVLLVVLAPVIMLLFTFFVLVPLAALAPAAPTISHTTFDCPFSKRQAHAAFVSVPGARRPNDVVECSIFTNPRDVRCKKQCLELAQTGWTPSPMVPRYALLADGAAYREAA